MLRSLACSYPLPILPSSRGCAPPHSCTPLLAVSAVVWLTASSFPPCPPLPAAPSSAHAVRSFKPYCIFQGNESAPIHAWLRQHNVTIIRHVPKWRDELVVRAKTKAKV